MLEVKAGALDGVGFTVGAGAEGSLGWTWTYRESWWQEKLETALGRFWFGVGVCEELGLRLD